MAKSIDLKNLDRRIAEKMIRSGQITQAEWDKQLASLPDVAEAGEPIETELETGVIETE
ncbi:MAG TPA: hypothetical protein VGD74_11440 [Vulgatibacter sp.]